MKKIQISNNPNILFRNYYNNEKWLKVLYDILLNKNILNFFLIVTRKFQEN